MQQTLEVQLQSLEVVRSLANGVDPETGEIFPADSPYQRAGVVRALYAASAALERAAETERRRARLPARVGTAWDADEDARLLAGFDAGDDPTALARAHQRTRASVRARLLKLGRSVA